MERLNWAVLGLIGIVTALGLSTSSAGKTKTNEQPVSISAATDAPACCRSHSETTPVAATTPATTKAAADECSGNCQETGVCCDKSLPKSETAAAAKTETSACEGECCLSKKSDAVAAATTPANAVCEGECCLSKQATASATATTDCPLTKASEMIENLTKNYVCEGGECLTKPGQGTLILKQIKEPAKPEGLSNLLAAAAAVEVNQAEAAKTEGDTTANTITISSGDLTKSGTGTLTLQLTADTKLGDAKAALAKIAAPQSPADNSRAAARAAKLAKIEAKLEAPWELESEKITLEELASVVQQKYGVPVIIDRKALEEAAFDLQTPITVAKQPEIEAGEYLRGALRDLTLTWIIPASNDRVLITTISAMENTPIRRVYEVTDLVGDDPESLLQQLESTLTPIIWVAGNSSNLMIRNHGPRCYLMATHDYWSQQELKMLLEDLRLQATDK